MFTKFNYSITVKVVKTARSYNQLKWKKSRDTAKGTMEIVLYVVYA